MEILFKSIHYKLRISQMDILEVAELERRGIISEEVCEVFEKAERLYGKRKRKQNILKWWLGWSNHRKLVKVLRETRLDIRKSKHVTVNSATPVVTEVKDYKADEYLLEDVEVSYRPFDDTIEDFDDDDYREELRLAEEEAEFEFVSIEVVNELDEVKLSLDAADNDEEQILIDFAANQMERMNMIRENLLAIPSEIESFSVDNILTLPLGQRWMLFAQWKRSYQ